MERPKSLVMEIALWHSESHHEALCPYIFTCRCSLQRSGSRPLVSTTLPMLGPRKGSSWLFCSRSVWWRSCNFETALRSLHGLQLCTFPQRTENWFAGAELGVIPMRPGYTLSPSSRPLSYLPAQTSLLWAFLSAPRKNAAKCLLMTLLCRLKFSTFSFMSLFILYFVHLIVAHKINRT